MDCEATQDIDEAMNRVFVLHRVCESPDLTLGKHPDQSKPVNSASKQVFTITELAEAIFLQLSMKDLLCGVVQVSKQWQNVVDKSSQLQEHLFLRPISKPVAARRKGSCQWTTTRKPRQEVAVISHPYIGRLLQPASEPFQRLEASWQKHFLTQPPVESIVFDCNYGPQTRNSEDGKGVRMMDIGSRVRLYHIAGWSTWYQFKNHAQLQDTKYETVTYERKSKVKPVDELVLANEAMEFFEWDDEQN